jgi:hypothetical protein
MKPLLYAVPSLILFQCIPIETMKVISSCLYLLLSQFHYYSLLSSISISLLRFLNFLKDAF